jgi:hypothetical protein
VIKMTGIGLASAVLVDVTLVRLFMAPAALTLLGDRLWPSRRRAALHPVARVGGDVVTPARAVADDVRAAAAARTKLGAEYDGVVLASLLQRLETEIGAGRPRPRLATFAADAGTVPP